MTSRTEPWVPGTTPGDHPTAIRPTASRALVRLAAPSRALADARGEGDVAGGVADDVAGGRSAGAGGDAGGGGAGGVSPDRLHHWRSWAVSLASWLRVGPPRLPGTRTKRSDCQRGRGQPVGAGERLLPVERQHEALPAVATACSHCSRHDGRDHRVARPEELEHVRLGDERQQPVASARRRASASRPGRGSRRPAPRRRRPRPRRPRCQPGRKHGKIFGSGQRGVRIGAGRSTARWPSRRSATIASASAVSAMTTGPQNTRSHPLDRRARCCGRARRRNITSATSPVQPSRRRWRVALHVVGKVRRRRRAGTARERQAGRLRGRRTGSARRSRRRAGGPARPGRPCGRPRRRRLRRGGRGRASSPSARRAGAGVSRW